MMSIFERICLELDLGKLIEEPKKLTGGFMHEMYSLFTTKGNYAIKLLNPHIMKRNEAMSNFLAAEALENKLSSFPILPSLTFNNKKMQEIDGQYYYIFDWYEGKSINNNEIEIKHCVSIAKTLAHIHQVDIKEGCSITEKYFDFKQYLPFLSKELCCLLKDNLEILERLQTRGNDAVKKMPNLVTICHNDMDSKNVLWHIDDYRIIDLECLGYSSPYSEVLELALSWSGFETCHLNYEMFKIFMKTYQEHGGFLDCDFEVVYDTKMSRLEWLDYNLKRSLGIDCGKEEIEIGISEVKKTIPQLVYYDDERKNILKCLEEIV